MDFLKLPNGIGFNKEGMQYLFERANHPYTNDSYTTRHRFTYPTPESAMPTIDLRYELQTSKGRNEVQQAIKVSFKFDEYCVFINFF